MMQKATEGTIREVTYWWPRPGSDKPLEKTTFYTKVGDQICSWLLQGLNAGAVARTQSQSNGTPVLPTITPLPWHFLHGRFGVACCRSIIPLAALIAFSCACRDTRAARATQSLHFDRNLRSAAGKDGVDRANRVLRFWLRRC